MSKFQRWLTGRCQSTKSVWVPPCLFTSHTDKFVFSLPLELLVPSTRAKKGRRLEHTDWSLARRQLSVSVLSSGQQALWTSDVFRRHDLGKGSSRICCLDATDVLEGPFIHKTLPTRNGIVQCHFAEAQRPWQLRILLPNLIALTRSTLMLACPCVSINTNVYTDFSLILKEQPPPTVLFGHLECLLAWGSFTKEYQIIEEVAWRWTWHLKCLIGRKTKATEYVCASEGEVLSPFHIIRSHRTMTRGAGAASKSLLFAKLL